MESTKDISIAQVVESKAGRDKGRIFIVYDIIDENCVSVVDGDLRRIQKPKKKKIRHLKAYKHIIEPLSTKIIEGEKLNNAYIRKLLASYIEGNK